MPQVCAITDVVLPHGPAGRGSRLAGGALGRSFSRGVRVSGVEGASAPQARAAEDSARSRRMLRASVFGLGLKGLGVLLALASQVVLARLLGVEGFGVYVTVVAWTTVLAVLGGFGMPLAAVRFLPLYVERQNWAAYRGFLHDSWRLAMASSLAISALALVAFGIVPALRPMLGAMLLGIPQVLLLALSGIVVSVLVAGQMPLRADGLFNVTRPILVILLVLAAWLQGGGNADSLDAHTALAMTIAAGVLTLVLQAVALRPLVAPHWRGPRSFSERPLWLASGIATLTGTAAYALMERLDTIMLSALVSPAEAGSFGVVSRLTLLIGVALTPVMAATGPIAAQLLARGDREGLQRVVGQGALVGTGLAVALGGGLVLFLPLLLRLFGPDFDTGRSIAAILVLGQVASAMAGLAGFMLTLGGNNRTLVLILLGAVLLDFVLCMTLIPRFGALGAGVATTVSLAVNAVALAAAAWRAMRVNCTVFAGIRRLVPGSSLGSSE